MRRKDKLMKNIIITCRINPTYMALDFYTECKGESYYIFTRKYRKSLFNYFKNGISIHRLFELKKAHGNDIIINTINQLKGALRYLEKENDVQIFNTRHDSSLSYRRRKEYDCYLAA